MEQEDMRQDLARESGSQATPEAASASSPIGFDPARVPLGLYRIHWASGGTSLASVYMDSEGARWIAPTNWMRPSKLEVEGWGAVERLEPLDGLANAIEAMEFACAALREVGDDYPGSSCQLWCHERAEEAESMALGVLGE